MRAVAGACFVLFLGAAALLAARDAQAQKPGFFSNPATSLQPMVPTTSASARKSSEIVEQVGTITVKHAENGGREAVLFTTEDGSEYVVKLQGQARMLATADGRKAEIKGRVLHKNGETILLVQKLKLLP